MKLDNENPDFTLLDQAAKHLRETAVPAGPPATLVMETFAAMEHSRRRVGPLAAVLALVAMLLAAIGGWAWFSRNGGAELAFADVMQQVARTSTVEATLIIYPDNHEQPRIAKLMIKGTRGRIEGDDGEIDISDDETGEDLNLNPKTMTAMHSVFSDKGTDLYTELRRIGDSIPTPIGEKAFNGRVLEGFAGTVELLGLRNLPANVWVDLKTKLPVRIEMLSAARGPLATVFEDIRFDVPLDDSLFGAMVPKGYRVVECGGLTRAQLGALPAATSAQIAQMVLRPKWGIGSLPFSARREQIARVLGEPAKPAMARVLSYPALGLTLYMDVPSRGLIQIQVGSAAYSDYNIRDFPGRTQEGIRIGSSRADVERSYGKPDDVDGLGEAFAELSYNKLGMNVTVIDGRVSKIMLFPPSRPAVKARMWRNPATEPMPKVVAVVPLPANVGPAPTEAQLQRLMLKPGVGIGDVEFGATRQQVVAMMGEPQGVMRVDTTELITYAADGLTLNMGTNGVLEMIIASGDPAISKSGTTPRRRPFAGWTDKHIRIGSTRDQVIAAYGKHYVEIGVRVTDHPEVHETQLLYRELGLSVILDKQTNRCVGLWLIRPISKSGGIPSPTTNRS